MLALLLAVGGCQLAWTASASATVQMTQSVYNVSENAGHATIVVTRTGSLAKDQYVSYGSHRLMAVQGIDYHNVSGHLHFLPGQSTLSYTIPIVPYNFYAPSINFATYLYGSYPDHLGNPHSATVWIHHNNPLEVRDPANPLELNPAPTNGNPLSGARFFVDAPNSPTGVLARRYRHSNPHWSRMLSIIANQPYTSRYGKFTGRQVALRVFLYLQHAYLKDPGAVPFLSTYRVVAGQCAHGGKSDTPAQVAAYQDFIHKLSFGIGNFRAVLLLEMDSIITASCFDPHGLAVRLGELKYAITYLQRNPHLVVYLDGGAADVHPWQWTARMLNRAGVRMIQGFFLNSTHFDWTTRELAYGQKIARWFGGKVHFVVNTGTNGQGPLVPPDPAHQGSEVLCNPPGRGLGPKPTSHTGYRWADAFAWTSSPGETGGACNGGPSKGIWVQYAVGLAERANFNVTGPGKQFLIRDDRARR